MTSAGFRPRRNRRGGRPSFGFGLDYANPPVGLPIPASTTYSAAVLADSPTVYYRLSETSGLFVDVANGHHATPNGAIVTATGLIPSDSNAAAKFDWFSGTLKHADAGLTISQIPMTIECWINISSLAQDPAATGYFASPAAANALMSSGGWGLGHHSSTSGSPGVLYWVHNGVGDFNMNYTFAINTTYHLVIVVTTGHITAYVNGTWVDDIGVADMNTGAIGTLALANFAPFDSTMPRPSLNAMDEVAIYTTALSAARIVAHFDAANPPRRNTSQVHRTWAGR